MDNYDEVKIFLDYVYIYKRDAYRIILSVVEDHYTADELSHVVMVNAWKGFHRLKDPVHCKAWVKQITRNVIRKHMKEKSLYLKESDKEIIGELENMNELRLIERDILDAVVEREKISNVFEALNSLDEKYRLVIKLNLLNGVSLKDIADMYNMKPGTVRMLYSRGMKKLKEAYIKLEEGGSLDG